MACPYPPNFDDKEHEEIHNMIQERKANDNGKRRAFEDVVGTGETKWTRENQSNYLKKKHLYALGCGDRKLVFSVIDVCGVSTDTSGSRKYWQK